MSIQDNSSIYQVDNYTLSLYTHSMRKTRMVPDGYYKLRWQILYRDKFTCQYCGQSAPNVVLEVDHRVEIINGGTDDPDNLVTCCWACNHGKEGLRKSMVAAMELRAKRQRVITGQGDSDKPVIPSEIQPSMRQLVLSVLAKNPGISTVRIAAMLNANESVVRTRLNELKKAGLVSSTSCDERRGRIWTLA